MREVRLKLDVQGLGDERISDVDGQGGGVLKFGQFPWSRVCIISFLTTKGGKKHTIEYKEVKSWNGELAYTKWWTRVHFMLMRSTILLNELLFYGDIYLPIVSFTLFPGQTESCFSSFVNSLVFQFFFSSLKFNFIITLYPAVTECRHKVIISGLNRKKAKNLVICISYHSITCTIWPIFYEFLIFFAMRWRNGGYKNYVIPQMIW